jgi:hypothetical protein
LTDPAGLLPSSFANIRLDVLPGSRCSATSGVDPTQSSMVGYLMLTLPESTHRMIVQSLLPANNEPNLSSERLNLTPVIQKEGSVKRQDTKDLDRDSLRYGEGFPQPEVLDHGPLATLPAPNHLAPDSHIQIMDLAQLLAQHFHPLSTQRGNINIDSIGRQLALHLGHRLGAQIYFSASHTMPRHFNANLLELKTMVARLSSHVKAANLERKSLSLMCQWSASDKRIDCFATTAMSDQVLVSASCPDCIPLDNRFPQQNRRARVTLDSPFDAMIVERWLLRQGIGLAEYAEPGPMLHISEGAITHLPPKTNVTAKDRRPELHVIARADHPSRWLSDIEQTILTTFQGGPGDHHRTGVTVIHSFNTDPNQSPLIRLLIQSKTKFRMATEYGTLGRQQHSIWDALLVDFTPHGANLDRMETSQTLNSWPDAIIITQDPLTQSSSIQSSSIQNSLNQISFNETIKHKSLSLHGLENILTALGPGNNLTQALSNALTTEQSELNPKHSIPAAKTPWQPARPTSDEHEVAAALIFDEKLALVRAGGNKALALELKAMLRSTLQDDLIDLVTAARAHDLERARGILHKMTGGLAMTGASKLEGQVRTAYLELRDATNISKLNAVIIHAEQLLTILSQAKTH